MDITADDIHSKYSNFLVHYYRGEVTRETFWRNRLDVTTNWAIVMTAALLTFVFGTPEANHVALLINYLIVWFFLYIESRRFRYYALVKDRVRIFEKRILGPLMGMQDDEKREEWLTELSDKLIKPKIKMSRLEAMSWRLRHNYLFIFFIIFSAWVYKVSIYPREVFSLGGFIANADAAFIPGIIVVSAMVASLLVIIGLVFYVSRKWSGNDLP